MTTKLRDFIDDLTEVELSQHTFGDIDDIGEVVSLPKLIRIINRGITKLHTDFLIKQGTAYVCVDPCVNRYKICHKNTKYIRTEDCPVRLLEILEVLSCDGRPTRINATHITNPDVIPMETVDIWMPKYNMLEFNNTSGLFRVNFRRNGELIPNPVEYEDFDLRDFTLDIPDAYLDALTYYICARVFAPSQPADGYAAAYSPSVMYKAKYQEEVDKLKYLLNHQLEGVGNYQQRFNETGMP